MDADARQWIDREMTTPSDRQAAIFRAGEILCYLAGWRQDCGGKNLMGKRRIPVRLRREATEILRHFPLSAAELNQIKRAPCLCPAGKAAEEDTVTG